VEAPLAPHLAVSLWLTVGFFLFWKLRFPSPEELEWLGDKR